MKLISRRRLDFLCLLPHCSIAICRAIHISDFILFLFVPLLALSLSLFLLLNRSPWSPLSSSFSLHSAQLELDLVDFLCVFLHDEDGDNVVQDDFSPFWAETLFPLLVEKISACFLLRNDFGQLFMYATCAHTHGRTIGTSAFD